MGRPGLDAVICIGNRAALPVRLGSGGWWCFARLRVAAVPREEYPLSDVDVRHAVADSDDLGCRFVAQEHRTTIGL